MERSVLYNIKPIGMGTPLVESLTSYITRLAEAHCVLTGDLISKIYAPLLNKEYLLRISNRGGNGFFDSAIGINGLGKLAYEFTELTNSFTGRTDISCTTLQNWSSILPNRGLFKKTKSWCPDCFEELRVNEEVIYEPLIWNIQMVNYCIKHRTKLVNLCENCKRTVPVISRKSIPGFCSRCGNWLGTNSSKNEGIKEDVNEFFTDISYIGELLSKNELDLSNTNLTESINFYVNNFFEKSLSKTAQYFNIPKTTFRMWVSGENLPSLNYLVRMCKVLGISIVEFLQTKEPLIKQDTTVCLATKKIKHDHEEIKSILNKVIETKQPISISGVAMLIGCDRKLLSNMYIVECNQIKENYNSFLLTKKEQRISEKNKQLNETFNLLVNQGVYPSRRKLEEQLGIGFLKEKALQEKWNELKKESCFYDLL
ncbi:TniQ family protein [Bacillus sp. JJ1521]|uniref:TniQ family protein n=1 Tax=Bacillus sp. JJ1521 TaxID=3122957 RepID=UPI0030001671